VRYMSERAWTKRVRRLSGSHLSTLLILAVALHTDKTTYDGLGDGPSGHVFPFCIAGLCARLELLRGWS
jgi:hypothetical protein